MIEVNLGDLGYKPRQYQIECHKGLMSKRWGVIVAHRRFGKTVMMILHLIFSALEAKRPDSRYAYIAPTYKQAKMISWDYLKAYSLKIPNTTINESELRIDFPNGSRIRLFGADNYDAMRGAYFDGVCLDEYGMMKAEVYSQVVRPALADRKGWAVFIGTPNGKNNFYDVYENAKSSDEWFVGTYKASYTNVIDYNELNSAKALMTDDEFQQEFECSFSASVRGSYYGNELALIESKNQITKTVLHEKHKPVMTFWDLGVSDSTSIWFAQVVGSEIRLIDYYENSGCGLEHYVSKLKEKASELGYNYTNHYAPHDIQVRELGTGKSRLEIARNLGINFDITPNLSIKDGIDAVRLILPRCWFNAETTRRGVECLKNYRKDFNEKLGEWRDKPIHDWSSHGADAFRYLAVSIDAVRDSRQARPVVSVSFGGF